MTLTNFKMGLTILPALTLLALMPSAHASTIFTLTQDGCTGTCGTGPFGTITVTQDSATQLTVVETLAANERFAGTGAGDALEFNFNTAFTFGNISAGFDIGPAPDTASTFGTFFQSITCTACQGGQAGNPPGPLSFTLTNASGLSISNFVANAGGYYFASDIVGNNGNTGNVAANSFVTQAPPPAVPEPVSLVLVGSALLGLGVIQVRRGSRKGLSAK